MTGTRRHRRGTSQTGCETGRTWSSGNARVDAVENPKDEVTIAIIGKYVEHKDAYKSLGEALRHGGLKQSTRVNLRWLESEDVETRGGGDSQ